MITGTFVIQIHTKMRWLLSFTQLSISSTGTHGTPNFKFTNAVVFTIYIYYSLNILAGELH